MPVVVDCGLRDAAAHTPARCILRQFCDAADMVWVAVGAQDSSGLQILHMHERQHWRGFAGMQLGRRDVS